MAYRFLKGNLGRTLFPLLGVIVGATALIMTLSLGGGAKRVIDRDLLAIGGNRILVGGRNLSNRDLEVVERLPFVEYAIFPEKTVLVNNNIFKAHTTKALKARKLLNLRENEVILDKGQFTGKRVGDRIELDTGRGRSVFLIRDLYQEESPFETMKAGNRVIVSDITFDKIFGRKDYNSLVVSFPQDEDGEQFIPIVLRELNRSRLGYDQVKILETPDIYKKVERIRGFVSKGLFILSFISLFVGGIGVLNLIAAAVRERGSQIGILRAMGMNRNSLIEIFLLEAIIVVTVGTAIGIALGVIMSYLAGMVLGIPPYFNFMKMVLALVCTLGVGTIFGMLPAKKAGALNVVDALKI